MGIHVSRKEIVGGARMSCILVLGVVVRDLYLAITAALCEEGLEVYVFWRVVGDGDRVVIRVPQHGLLGGRALVFTAFVDGGDLVVGDPRTTFVLANFELADPGVFTKAGEWLLASRVDVQTYQRRDRRLYVGDMSLGWIERTPQFHLKMGELEAGREWWGVVGG